MVDKMVIYNYQPNKCIKEILWRRICLFKFAENKETIFVKY